MLPGYFHNPAERPKLEKILMDEGRIQKEARMLPDGPLTLDQRDDVATALRAYIKKHGYTLKQVAKQIAHLSAPSLSQILDGKYAVKKIDDHLRELNLWMEADARRQAHGVNRPFVETSVAVRIFAAAQYASDYSAISLCHGPTGIGKSFTAAALLDQYPNAMLLRFSTGGSSYRAFWLKVAHAANCQRNKYDDDGLFNDLRQSNRMLIIDEAHRMTDRALEFMRDLWDETKIPILLLATVDLLDRVRRDCDADHGQLFSRISYVCDLVNDPRDGDGGPRGNRKVFTRAELKKIFENQKLRIDNDALGYLEAVVNVMGFGSLRVCGTIIRHAERIERQVHNLADNEPVTVTRRAMEEANGDRSGDEAMKLQLQRIAGTA